LDLDPSQERDSMVINKTGALKLSG
jgi:hypothetical protein